MASIRNDLFRSTDNWSVLEVSLCVGDKSSHVQHLDNESRWLDFRKLSPYDGTSIEKYQHYVLSQMTGITLDGIHCHMWITHLDYNTEYFV